jgi:hypothetical protein
MSPSFYLKKSKLVNAPLAKLQQLRQLSNLWDNCLGTPGTRFPSWIGVFSGAVTVWRRRDALNH